MTVERLAIARYLVTAIVALSAAVTLSTRPSGERPRVAPEDRARRAWVEVDASLARLDAGLPAIDARIEAALREQPGCPSRRDLETARARLERLRCEKAELEKRLRRWRGDRTICRLPRRADRRIFIPRACVENPLAPGCM